jgi:hypothetical protein
MPMDSGPVIEAVAHGLPDDRVELWSNILNGLEARRIAEVGVWRGQFAEAILKTCPAIQTYHLIDPWRNLADWNKPLNISDREFEQVKAEALSRTEFARERRVVLQGRTAEVIDQIPDGSLDFVYIDGDHTLRGVTVDLLKFWPKLREGGVLGGDDFAPTIWQHTGSYEPTVVFPWVVYFAEAVDSRCYGLPFSQFAICKTSGSDFSFQDLSPQRVYSSTSLKDVIWGSSRSGNPPQGLLRRAARLARKLIPRT